jgi:hypothetical protein
MKEVQFLSDDSGKPVFAVLPMAVYQALIEQQESGKLPAAPSLLSADSRHVKLPYGGPEARLDLLRLADLCQRLQTTRLAIGHRAQGLDKFSAQEVRHGLDPWIRSFFLGDHSPYKNTMQATSEVVEALVASGLFERATLRFDHYHRAVKSLKVNQAALRAFLDRHGPLAEKDQVKVPDGWQSGE